MIRGGPFSGIAPKYASHILPNNAGTIAKNCLFESGELRPLKGTTFVWTPTKVGTIKTIWRYLGQYWFHWLEDVNVVASPLANDAYGRAYWTGEAQPRMTTASIATAGGGTNYPNNYYILGVPAPASKATVNVGTPSDEENIQSRAYIYTYVSAYGEEGPNAETSDYFDTTDGDSVTVTLPSTGPTGAYNITHKNIYRLNSGVYQFLAQIPVGTTEYVDTVLNAALGDVIESTTYDPPPSGLKGLIALANGSLAGFNGNEFCISVPYLPHAWPSAYRFPLVGEIASIGAFGNFVLVTMESGKPYVFTVSDPDSVYKEHAEIGQSCMSKRALVDMGDVIIYPSPIGVNRVGVGDNTLLTQETIEPVDWVGYANPSGSIGAKYHDNFLLFTTVDSVEKCFIFNAKSGNLSTCDIFATAVYSDEANGILYLCVDGDIVTFNTGAVLDSEWQSKEFILGKSTNFRRGKIRASQYPVSLSITVETDNGSRTISKTINDKKPFALPSGFKYDKFQYKIRSKNNVKSVSFANSIGELQ